LILGMGRVQWFWPLAAGLFLLSAGTSALFHRAHRELHPQRGADRFSGLMKMILYPPAAIRVWDILTAPLLAGYHPLMVGRLLLGSDDFQTFAGRWVRAMRYPIVTGPAARGAADPEAWGAAQRTVAMEFLARETDITADWFAPPKADGAVAWCPRCQATFTQDAGDCPDCPGVGLRPFGPLQSASDREEGT
jgi:hypothetical protein